MCQFPDQPQLGYAMSGDIKQGTKDPCNPRSYVPPPLISHHVVMAVGFTIFLFSYFWLPSLLVFCYLASQLASYSFRVTDESSQRRQAYQVFLKDTTVPIQLRSVPDDVVLQEKYWTNSRGMLLYTSVMLPKYDKIKGVVCFCHGYSDNASHLSRIANFRLVRAGFAVVAIEYEGHGRSDGPSGLIYDWDLTVEDVKSYFEEAILRQFCGMKVFLMGESMGGAIAFCVYQKRPDLFDGIVFVSPMCKISDEMRPPDWVIDAFQAIAGPQGTNGILGYLPITPAKNSISEHVYKRPSVKDMAAMCPTNYCRNLRLTAARELLFATCQISEQMKGLDAPFLVLHGKDDVVTDPKLSQELYEEASSLDKSIRLYDGMWHSIVSGEPDDSIDQVFRDITNWLCARI